VHLPVRISPEFCQRNADGGRHGAGLAACQDLGLLVISSCDKLQVFALPDDIVARCHVQSELAHVRTLGGVAPMDFQFGYSSGCMAFTHGCDEAEAEATSTLLLVTDGSCCGAVHVADVVRGAHVGYVAAPGTIRWPRGVATRQSRAAVSCWGSKAVRVFEGSGASWTAVRVIVGGNSWPSGLRFTADCSRLVVANDCGVSIFCAKDGAFLCDIVPVVPDAVVYPMDVEECGSEWIMCHSAGLVKVADASITDAVLIWRQFDSRHKCSALATAPGLGLLVVRLETGVQFFATPDAVAMAAMSSCKVAWMVAVCRGGTALRCAKAKGKRRRT
jgi:hypothetical protein